MLDVKKNIYRIVIKSKHSDEDFFFWIGKGLELVHLRADAVEVTNEEHLTVMEKIQCEATAYLD